MTAARFKAVYAGAAGMIVGLAHLGRDVSADRLVESYFEEPDGGERTPSYLVGAVGVLLAAWLSRPSATVADALFAQVEINTTNPANELFLGAPGTMLAALFMYEQTGEVRWAELYRRNADHLWNEWRYDWEYDCHLWIQNRKGRLIRSIGAGHGFASNAHSLLRGETLLEPNRRMELHRRAAETATRFALVEDGRANWPTIADPFWAAQEGQEIRVQWCHGAPGVITSLATVEGMDDLLAAAGELAWEAGPLVKGHGLCHGTAGNGHAFLALHERTGDRLWLDRARAFAMHGIAQYERKDRPRYSLWTGDIGLAVYLSQCLEARAGLVTLDWV